jgi:hypothetical protein
VRHVAFLVEVLLAHLPRHFAANISSFKLKSLGALGKRVTFFL